MTGANFNDKFELKDVGITHPDNDAFIKIDEGGRIYIMSQPNLGIVIDPSRQSVAFVGDRIKMITKDDEGLKWNNLSFNPQAFNFAEPTFLYSKDTTNFIYDDIDRFLD
jgi:hypothetical protein